MVSYVAIPRYVRRRLTSLAGWAREACRSLVDHSYRVGFTNFWPGIEDGSGPWFYPLIADVLRAKYPGKGCRISRYRPHLEMFSVFGSRKNVSRSRAPRKAFFTGECVRSAVAEGRLAFGDNCVVEVDLALGFDPPERVGSPRYMRFPLWILYYFSPLDSKDDVARKVMEFNECRFPKSRFCALVARHDTDGTRKEIFVGLSRIDRVDSAGRILHNDDSLVRDFGDDKGEYLKRYKFNICPENTRSEGYVTEKLFQAFGSGCVPIYAGFGRDPEPEVVESGAIIFWRPGEDNSEAADLVGRLHRNDAELERFLRTRPLKDSAVDFVWRSLRDLRSRFEEILDFAAEARS